MTAIYDLEKLKLVAFQNVEHGNTLTADGRDVAATGLASLWPDIFGSEGGAWYRTTVLISEELDVGVPYSHQLFERCAKVSSTMSSVFA